MAKSTKNNAIAKIVKKELISMDFPWYKVPFLEEKGYAQKNKEKKDYGKVSQDILGPQSLIHILAIAQKAHSNAEEKEAMMENMKHAYQKTDN